MAGPFELFEAEGSQTLLARRSSPGRRIGEFPGPLDSADDPIFVDRFFAEQLDERRCVDVHRARDEFTRGFLVVTPGVTIRDRLRVLQPNDPDSYYASCELVPSDRLRDLERAKIMGGMEKSPPSPRRTMVRGYSVDGVIETRTAATLECEPSGSSTRTGRCASSPRIRRGGGMLEEHDRIVQMVLRRRARGPDSVEHGREHREGT